MFQCRPTALPAYLNRTPFRRCLRQKAELRTQVPPPLRVRSIAAPPTTEEEMCVIVNARNEVVGAERRSVAIRNRLMGRGAYVFVFNSKGELLVSKRSNAKDCYPGLFDVVISGAVTHGEDYRDTALRELSEEIGANVCDLEQSLEELFHFPYEDEVCHFWGCAYKVVYDGPIKLQDEEVDWCNFWPIDKVTSTVSSLSHSFTPVGAHILQNHLLD